MANASVTALHRVGDADLLRRARTGDDRAIEELLERYRGLARTRARAFFLPGAGIDDVVQEAMIGLFKAIRDFDPAADTPFPPFAELCISRQLMTAVKSANRLKHDLTNSAVSLDSPVRGGDEPVPLGAMLPSGESTDPELQVIAADEVMALRDALLGSLSALEGEVLRLYVEGRTYEEIAGVLGVHRKTVDNTLQRVKTKLNRHIATRAS